MTRCPPRRASLLALLALAACGTDPIDPGSASTSTSTSSTGPGATTALSTALSTTATLSTTDAATTASTPPDGAATGSSSGDGPDDLSTAGPDTIDTTGDAPSTTDEAGTGGTGEPPPPPDPCAAQDKAAPAIDEPGAINDDPRFIHVYVNNIENLKLAGEQCPGDWTDLIYYMKTIKPSPDLFLVQQISDTAQLDVLVQRMTKELPGVYEGVIADADPWTQQSPCGKEKAKQTNAIVFRSGRFARLGDKHVWQSWAHKNGECVRNNQARTRNVMVKLRDKIADRELSVASIHWSTAQGDGPDPACARKNVLEADQKLHLKAHGGDLLIFGGDFNESDRNAEGKLRPWYAEANGDAGGPLNYRDPIYRACQGKGGLQACLDDNWTVGSGRRIDALFAQTGAGCRARSSRAHTITYNEADAAAEADTGVPNDAKLNYSEHRAIRAAIFY